MEHRLSAQFGTRVCLGVCTFRRPEMLTACLESLMLQIVPSPFQVEIIVVDNEPYPNNRRIVNALRPRSPIAIHYSHEPRRGIAAARNRVLDTAIGRDADWILFIDDDEEADPFWVVEMMAAEYADTPILQGPVVPKFPHPVPFWVTKRDLLSEPRGKEGELRRTGCTGNLRLSIAIPKRGIRFDETLGLMGGEDNEMLTRAQIAGFEIRRTLRGVVTETAHRERLTFAGKAYRAYWCAASDMRRTAIVHGWTGAFIRKGIFAPLRMATGVVELAISPLCLALGVDMFKRRALAGGKKIAKGAGRLVAMTGHLPQPYRHVHGG